jgi:O-antigen/teichoic acid export membrane protein
MIKTIFSHDFRHTAINQLWRLVSGPLMLILIPLYLSAEAQGYWYTFISLAALAVFADMGFSTILLQFSAHEFAHLKFEENKTFSGAENYLERLASLFRFAMKWSAGMGLIAFPIILVVGFVILSEKQSDIYWGTPWIIYGLASVFIFVNSMLLSFIEGCNSVGEVQKIRFYISFFTAISTMILLVFDQGLYSLAIGLGIGAISGTMIIFYKYKYMIMQLLALSKETTHNWKKEILPLVGRYAVSWISGYFIFSIFTPIAFHYYGVVEAGQIGFSIAICTAIFGIANIWMTIITPKINMNVAHKDYKSLNSMFKRHLILAALTYILGIIVLFIIVIYFKDILPFASRLVSLFSLSIIATGWFFQIVINSLAIYMRAHKEEPLMVLSFLSGVYISILTLLIAIYLPFEYFFIGFLSSYIITIPWVLLIFKKYKEKSW